MLIGAGDVLIAEKVKTFPPLIRASRKILHLGFHVFAEILQQYETG